MHFRINAATHENRYEATAAIESAIADVGGFIVDHYFYSNISTVLMIELPTANLHKLTAALHQLNLTVKADELSECSGDTCTGTLQITFVHNDPDLRHEVPNVPG